MAGRQANWDAVPAGGGGVLERRGHYLLAIEQLIETPSASGKLMYKGTLRVEEPTQNAGFPLFENFVIGTDDDPDASDPATWGKSVGAKILRRMLEKAAVPLDADMDRVCAAATGQKVIGYVAVEKETKPGQYQGRERNNIKQFYAIGERPIGYDDAAPAGNAGGRARLAQGGPALVKQALGAQAADDDE